MNSDEIEIQSSRAEFVATVIGRWQALNSDKDSKRANKLVKQNDKLVKSVFDKGQLVQFLEPLLADDSIKVRYAAAAYLYRYGFLDLAVPQLEEISQHPTDVVAMNARLALSAMKKEGN